MITLIVKGTTAEAVRAAAHHGVYDYTPNGSTSHGEQIGLCSNLYFEAVASWFYHPEPETTLVEYRPGTLLFFNYRGDE